MIYFLMICGVVLLFFVFPASIIATIVFAIRRKKLRKPVMCIVVSFFVGIIMLSTGGILYGETDEYQQQLIESEKQSKEEETIKQEAEEEAEKEKSEQQEAENEKAENEKAEREKAEKEKEEQEKAEKEKAEKEKKANTFKYADITIEYLRSEIAYNSIDDKCLYVYFQMTNNSDENQAFSYLVDCQAFQNGIELDNNYIYDCDEEENGSKEIQPGATITVAKVFDIGDSTEAVTLEVRPFNIWSDRLLFEKELQITE